MVDTITKRERPSAASQAANTSKIIGNMVASVRWVFRMVIVIITNRESIIPSRHRREDIIWDRYISKPNREMVNAKSIFMQVRDIR